MEEFVKLILDEQRKHYRYKGASYSSSIEMEILGIFLTSDVGCYWPSFKEWVLDDTQTEASSNATHMEKEGDHIFLSDIYPVIKKPKKLKMSCTQLVQLLDDWKMKVCEKKPKEVVIKYENGQFFIETNDE